MELVHQAYNVGIDRVVVDLERRGKSQRQHGYHLELNDHTIRDIERIKAEVPVTVMCRLNPLYADSESEIENVLSAGADILMLPMFKAPTDAKWFVDKIGHRAKTSLLFETKEAVINAYQFRDLGADEIYIGLNDLSLAYGIHFPYEILLHGIVDQVRSNFPLHNFGFGGITILDKGSPLQTRNIMMELARLRSTQVILRRAFKRDVSCLNMRKEIGQLRDYFRELQTRPLECIAAQHDEVLGKIRDISNHLSS